MGRAQSCQFKARPLTDGLCVQVEARLRQMEGRLLAVDSSKPRGQAPTPKYDPARQGASSALLTEPAGYNTAADVTMDAAATQKPKVRCCCSCIAVCTLQAAVVRRLYASRERAGAFAARAGCAARLCQG